MSRIKLNVNLRVGKSGFVKWKTPEKSWMHINRTWHFEIRNQIAPKYKPKLSKKIGKLLSWHRKVDEFQLKLELVKRNLQFITKFSKNKKSTK